MEMNKEWFVCAAACLLHHRSYINAVSKQNALFNCTYDSASTTCIFQLNFISNWFRSNKQTNITKNNMQKKTRSLHTTWTNCILRKKVCVARGIVCVCVCFPFLKNRFPLWVLVLFSHCLYYEQNYSWQKCIDSNQYLNHSK